MNKKDRATINRVLKGYGMKMCSITDIVQPNTEEFFYTRYEGKHLQPHSKLSKSKLGAQMIKRLTD